MVAMDLVGVDMSRYGRLVLTQSSWDVLKGSRKVEFRSDAIRAAKKEKKKKLPVVLGAGVSDDVFQKLRALRLEIAKEQGLPPYVVFSDKTLLEMSAHLPRTEVEFSQVHGVGGVKASRYGPRFLELLRTL